jgi:hypothetical protein
VASANVLHQRVAADDHPRRTVTFQSPHRTQPRLEPAIREVRSAARMVGRRGA